MRVVVGLLAGCLLALGGCSSDKLVGRPDLVTVSQGEMPAPTRQDQVSQQRPYYIGPNDRLSISVYGIRELDQTVQADGNGKISVGLIGSVDATGKTPSELASELEQRFRIYVRQPKVTVNVEQVSQIITVEGEVQEPGLYPVAGRLTLLRSVALAKGLTAYANTNYVVVFRTVNGRKMAALYDLRAIRQGIYDDPEVYANDVVSIGESRSARIFQLVSQSSGLLAAPLVALLNR